MDHAVPRWGRSRIVGPLGEVCLLYADVADRRLKDLRLQEVLSGPERARIAKLLRAQDRALATTAWGLSRILLGRLTEANPSTLRFLASSHGKPYLADGPNFNMAHSGGAVLIGYTDAGRLGVDIEVRRRVADLGGLVEQFFAPAEIAEFTSLPDREQEAAFFRGWTRKEAFVKAVGLGLSMPLDSFVVSLASGWGPMLRAVEADAARSSPWYIRSVPVPGGFEAAIACEVESVRVTWIDLAELSS